MPAMQPGTRNLLRIVWDVGAWAKEVHNSGRQTAIADKESPPSSSLLPFSLLWPRDLAGSSWAGLTVYRVRVRVKGGFQVSTLNEWSRSSR